MKRIFTIIILVFLVLNLKAHSSGKEVSRARKVKAQKLIEKFNFDGKLTESVYNSNPVDGFIQRDPDEGKPATEKTNVWVSYDESNIYVSARLYDSDPSSIDASLMRRDNMVQSDWFFVYLDPYLDRRTGYYFGVNPGGSLLDGTLFNDSWDDDAWDGIWEARTNIDEKGWTVEMRIPFSQLRFNELDEMRWGINFNRDIKRKNEMTYFVMVPKNESGFVSHFATLEGLTGLKSRQRFEMLPYFVQKAQYLVHDAEDPFYKGSQYKTALGVDLKVGIGSNLNLDATINPDFGQVEVDPAVVNLSAFETYFQEKRPFFIEGSNILLFGNLGVNNNWGFNFGDPTMFYSRRIGRAPQGSVSDYDYGDIPRETRIIGAAKLSGKLNESWSIGAVSAVTERTFASIEYEDVKYNQEVEPLTHYGVLRTRREFDEGKSALGLMLTSVNRDLSDHNLRSALVKQAYTFGIDGFYTLDEDEEYVIKAYAIGSFVKGSKEAMQVKQEQPYRYYQRPDAENYSYNPDMTSMSGLYSRVMLNKQKGNFYINTALGVITPGFEYNDLGFQWNANKINGHMVLGYRFFEPYSIFRKSSHYLAYFRSLDFDGNTISNGIMTFNSWEFSNYYGFGIRASYNPDRISNTLTRGGPLALSPSEFWMGIDFHTDGKEKIVGYMEGDFWTARNGAYGYEFGFDIDWKPSTQLNISVGPSYDKTNSYLQWVDAFDDPLADYTFGRRYVFADIDYKTISANIRLNWTFTPQLSLQLFIQPFLSVGNYSNYKELAKPRTLEYNEYNKAGAYISYDAENEEYTIDPDDDGEAEPFVFTNPDFNFKSLRGNFVLRYEVIPGSVFYFVWTHDKTNFDHPGDMSVGRDFNNLWTSKPDNIFLVKFSYWFNM
ncbi:MAG: carbohydrate binding family 9 domain-containing protein [Melioribacteraceae bacterium]|nr:carbohydrate binding family 9 domain-containing protein [Melioribacteraceae bacterium]